MATAPQAVRGTTRSLYRATGIPADVELLENGWWKVSLDAGRVNMTGFFKPMGRGEYRWGESSLTIDGVKVGSCDGPEHLAKIIKDPDTHLINVPTEPDLRLGLVERDAGDAPAAVRHLWLGIEAHIGPEATAEIGLIDDNWVIAISAEDKWMVVTWELVRGDWYPSRQHVRIMVDGQIMTVPENEVERALAIILGNHPVVDAPSSSGRVNGTASAARDNAVEARRASVIRN